MISAGILGVAVASAAFAQVSYKLFFLRDKRRALLLQAFGLFATAQIAFFLALTQLEIGVVYMATGLIHVLILGLSRFVLDEHITSDHLIAVGAIVLGLVVYAA